MSYALNRVYAKSQPLALVQPLPLSFFSKVFSKKRGKMESRVYNSTGGIWLSFQGVFNFTGGIQISFLGVYNSTGGIQLSFQGVYNSTGGIQISFL